MGFSPHYFYNDSIPVRHILIPAYSSTVRIILHYDKTMMTNITVVCVLKQLFDIVIVRIENNVRQFCE